MLHTVARIVRHETEPYKVEMIINIIKDLYGFLVKTGCWNEGFFALQNERKAPEQD
ncbi:hypothetical protein GCM10011350_38450 [Marinomonas arctica]|nr:hypothetical protein GCM10011350_38450 [Marinomonas arctica]